MRQRWSASLALIPIARTLTRLVTLLLSGSIHRTPSLYSNSSSRLRLVRLLTLPWALPQTSASDHPTPFLSLGPTLRHPPQWFQISQPALLTRTRSLIPHPRNNSITSTANPSQSLPLNSNNILTAARSPLLSPTPQPLRGPTGPPL